MNNIFKYKFLAHRFVNYIFYAIVFVIGFICGLTIKLGGFNIYELIH